MKCKYYPPDAFGQEYTFTDALEGEFIGFTPDYSSGLIKTLSGNFVFVHPSLIKVEEGDTLSLVLEGITQLASMYVLPELQQEFIRSVYQIINQYRK